MSPLSKTVTINQVIEGLFQDQNNPLNSIELDQIENVLTALDYDIGNGDQEISYEEWLTIQQTPEFAGLFDQVPDATILQRHVTGSIQLMFAHAGSTQQSRRNISVENTSFTPPQQDLGQMSDDQTASLEKTITFRRDDFSFLDGYLWTLLVHAPLGEFVLPFTQAGKDPFEIQIPNFGLSNESQEQKLTHLRNYIHSLQDPSLQRTFYVELEMIVQMCAEQMGITYTQPLLENVPTYELQMRICDFVKHPQSVPVMDLQTGDEFVLSLDSQIIENIQQNLPDSTQGSIVLTLPRTMFGLNQRLPQAYVPRVNPEITNQFLTPTPLYRLTSAQGSSSVTLQTGVNPEADRAARRAVAIQTSRMIAMGLAYAFGSAGARDTQSRTAIRTLPQEPANINWRIVVPISPGVDLIIPPKTARASNPPFSHPVAGLPTQTPIPTTPVPTAEPQLPARVSGLMETRAQVNEQRPTAEVMIAPSGETVIGRLWTNLWNSAVDFINSVISPPESPKPEPSVPTTSGDDFNKNVNDRVNELLLAAVSWTGTSYSELMNGANQTATVDYARLDAIPTRFDAADRTQVLWRLTSELSSIGARSHWSDRNFNSNVTADDVWRPYAKYLAGESAEPPYIAVVSNHLSGITDTYLMESILFFMHQGWNRMSPEQHNTVINGMSGRIVEIYSGFNVSGSRRFFSLEGLVQTAPAAEEDALFNQIKTDHEQGRLTQSDYVEYLGTLITHGKNSAVQQLASNEIVRVISDALVRGDTQDFPYEAVFAAVDRVDLDGRRHIGQWSQERLLVSPDTYQMNCGLLRFLIQNYPEDIKSETVNTLGSYLRTKHFNDEGDTDYLRTSDGLVADLVLIVAKRPDLVQSVVEELWTAITSEEVRGSKIPLAAATGLANIAVLFPEFLQPIATQTLQLMFSHDRIAQNAVDVLHALTHRVPELIDPIQILNIENTQISPTIRLQILNEVLTPLVFKCPASFSLQIVQQMMNIYSVEELKYFLFYLSNRTGSLPNAVQAAQGALTSQDLFPLQRVVWEHLKSGSQNVLINYQWASAGLGDETLRTHTLIQALLDYNPQLTVTVITPRPFIYQPSNRLKVVGYDIRQRPGDVVHEERYSAVFEYNVSHEKGRGLVSVNFHDGVARSNIYDIVIDGVGGKGLIDQSLLQINDDRIYTESVYEMRMKFMAEMGLPFRVGEEPVTTPVAAVDTTETARLAWQQTTTGNTENRPVVLFNPFGGGNKAKGFVVDSQTNNKMFGFDQLGQHIHDLVALGYYVVLVTNGQEWGNEEIASGIISSLPDADRAYVTNTPAPRSMSDGTMNYFVTQANKIISVEGGLPHVAYALGVPFYVLFSYGTGVSDAADKLGSGTEQRWLPDSAGPNQVVTPGIDFQREIPGTQRSLLSD